MRKIVLISCVKSKQKVPAKAKDLYTSPLFRFNLQYAQQINPNAIYILSAKYGLLDLDQIIAPYEMTLNSLTEGDKKAWSRNVIDSLKKKADLKADMFVILAGINYRKYLTPELKHFQVPLQGLSFGKQLQELKRRIS